MGKAATNRGFRIALRAVVYRHGKWWIAHCLELDLVAEGRDPSSAIRDLLDISATQLSMAIEAGDLSSVFRSAPPEIWTLFSRAADVSAKSSPRALPRPIERFEAREAVLV
jgi:hypothetical protein